MIAGALLALTSLYLAVTVWRGQLFRPPFATWLMRHPSARPYLGWASGLAFGYGVPALVGLAVLGRLDAIVALPAPLAAAAGDAAGSLDAPALLSGLASGSGISALLGWWRARAGKPPLRIGALLGVLPRYRAQLLPAAILSLTAGVAEELFFRCYLPLLVTLVTGHPASGIGAATLLFALAHRYQGWAGVVVAGMTGALLGAVYLLSRELWLAMLCHAVIDLNALVIGPAAAGAWRR